MTEIAVSLPDELAREAREAGLLALERLLREEMEKRQQSRWAEIERELDERPEPDGMSMNEIAEEVRAYRAERRAQAAQ